MTVNVQYTVEQRRLY